LAVAYIVDLFSDPLSHVWRPEDLDDGCGRLELMPEPPQSLLFAPETWLKVIAVEK
jgi:hypothetical protein